MAQAVQVDPKELLRRENYLHEHQRPRDIKDPFTWPWRYRMAGGAVAGSIFAIHMNNAYMRKPWHYGMYFL